MKIVRANTRALEIERLQIEITKNEQRTWHIIQRLGHSDIVLPPLGNINLPRGVRGMQPRPFCKLTGNGNSNIQHPGRIEHNGDVVSIDEHRLVTHAAKGKMRCNPQFVTILPSFTSGRDSPIIATAPNT